MMTRVQFVLSAVLIMISQPSFGAREFVFRSERSGRPPSENRGFVSNEAVRIEAGNHRIFYDRPAAKLTIWEQGKKEAMGITRTELTQIATLLKSFGGMMKTPPAGAPGTSPRQLVSKGRRTVAGVSCEVKSPKGSNDEVCLAEWNSLGLSADETRSLKEFFAFFSELPAQLVPGQSGGNIVEITSQGKLGVPIQFRQSAGDKGELHAIRSVERGREFFRVPSGVSVLRKLGP